MFGIAYLDKKAEKNYLDIWKEIRFIVINFKVNKGTHGKIICNVYFNHKTRTRLGNIKSLKLFIRKITKHSNSLSN